MQRSETTPEACAPQQPDGMACDNCGQTMRWETSHSRCDRCGYIRPCCEGVPLEARPVDVPGAPR